MSLLRLPPLGLPGELLVLPASTTALSREASFYSSLHLTLTGIIRCSEEGLRGFCASRLPCDRQPALAA